MEKRRDPNTTIVPLPLNLAIGASQTEGFSVLAIQTTHPTEYEVWKAIPPAGTSTEELTKKFAGRIDSLSRLDFTHLILLVAFPRRSDMKLLQKPGYVLGK